ncbi:MaoC family dehydratase N-terminal domain-containing protein [Chloroflexota bacterium]
MRQFGVLTIGHRTYRIQLLSNCFQIQFKGSVSILPEEVTNFIGKPTGTSIFEVEKGAIRKVADAIDDPNPLYWDEEYAKNSRYGSIIAPPGFFGWPTKWTKGGPFFSEATEEIRSLLAKAGHSQTIDGGIDYAFFCPVRAGDTLAASSMIKHITERGDSAGKAVFVITETTYTNQNSDLVAKVRQISVHR